MAEDDQKPYAVGYAKPPKDTRFKPGQSGNPQGRPRYKGTVKAIVQQVGQELVPVSENRETLLVSKNEALIRSLYARALKGDNTATRLLLHIHTVHSVKFHL